MKKGTFILDDWWQGYELITPAGRQQLLKRTPENTLAPATGGPFPAVTIQNWQLACLPATSNGQPGEGFLALSPAGERYYLDHLVGERAAGIVQDVPPDGRFYLQRMLGTLYVSRVEDRSGNWVKYHYCPPPAYGSACGDMSGKLYRIEASDGRLVDLTWRSDARVIDHITVQAASTSPRTWQYEYASEILAASPGTSFPPWCSPTAVDGRSISWIWAAIPRPNPSTIAPAAAAIHKRPVLS